MSLAEFYRARNTMVKKTHSWKRILRVSYREMKRSRSLMIGIFFFTVNTIQKRAYRREFIRNMKELEESSTV
jgi:hypothetical protein